MQVIVNCCNTFDICYSDLAPYRKDIPYYSKKINETCRNQLCNFSEQCYSECSI